MIHHALFPTLVGEFNNQNHEIDKKVILDNALKHFTNGYSMETTGNVDIHLDPPFDPFFSFIAKSVGTYMDALSIRKDTFDVNLIKTWFNITKEFHTPAHSHADAHISFVYYVNIPEGVNKPIFFKGKQPNELFYGLSTDNHETWNQYNTPTWYFNPSEGTLFVFPGSLMHWTGGEGSGTPDNPVTTRNDLIQKRFAIAGDFLLTYKNNKLKKPYGIQPVSNWKRYDV
jgi:hypothetical protein